MRGRESEPLSKRGSDGDVLLLILKLPRRERKRGRCLSQVSVYLYACLHAAVYMSLLIGIGECVCFS